MVASLSVLPASTARACVRACLRALSLCSVSPVVVSMTPPQWHAVGAAGSVGSAVAVTSLVPVYSPAAPWAELLLSFLVRAVAHY